MVLDEEDMGVGDMDMVVSDEVDMEVMDTAAVLEDMEVITTIIIVSIVNNNINIVKKDNY